ncbi:MAG: bis(5-nucleosyl)-tetraphosphatase, symmetrical [Gammaproteobacteria bacterium]|jgi:bis(5'-nucleosyl)-tetraphosphatase (symmetrical)|nr:bis(5-nucleosyl)-tetraphosphatase, symmetrical [Gammaproteobacteria bacterium]
MPTYAIGDLQGCYDEFQQLLEKIHFDEAKDTLWLVGDLVNRGPKSLEVLRFCKNFQGQLHAVLGNHDLHLLATAKGVRKQSPSDTMDQILQAPDCDELLAWLQQRPLLHYDKSLNTIMVHAGIYPLWTLSQAKAYAQEVEQQLQNNLDELLQNMYGNVPGQWQENLTGWSRLRFIINAFTRMRALNADNSLNLAFDSSLADLPSGCAPWFEKLLPDYAAVKIVFGHWAALQGVTNKPNVFALDTGCVWGNALTARCLEDGKQTSVKRAV